MSLYRKFLRFWLTVASLIGFLLGWIFISHTIEPETSLITSSGDTLTITMPGIPSVESLADPTTDTRNLQTFTLTQNQSGFTPQMRTGGS